MRSLVLTYPQWQGAGEGHRAIALGAEASSGFVRALGDGNVEMARVPVSAEPGESQGGVQACSVLAAAGRSARRVIESRHPDRVITLGGDCACELAPVGYLRSRYGPKLGLVWLDAHADLVAPEPSTSGAAHGMALRFLLGEGSQPLQQLVPEPVDARCVLLAGVRELWPAEAEVAERLGIESFQVAELATSTAGLVASLRERGVREVALHVDVDVLDPSEFPAVGWPSPGGLSPQAVIRIIDDLAEAFDLVGIGMTEYRAPPETAIVRDLIGAFVGARRAVARLPVVDSEDELPVPVVAEAALEG